MRLTDRRRRQRLVLEFGERLVDRLRQLRGEHTVNLLVAQATDVGMQMCELRGHRLGEQVAARRGNLPELDEHPSRALEHQPHPVGEVGGVKRGGGPVADVKKVLGPGVGEDLAEAADWCEHGPRRPHGVTKGPPDGVIRLPAARHDVDHDRHRQRDQHAEEDRQRDDQRRVLVVRSERDQSDRQPDEPADHRGDGNSPAADLDPEHASADDADRCDPQRQDQQVAQPKLELDGDGGDQWQRRDRLFRRLVPSRVAGLTEKGLGCWRWCFRPRCGAASWWLGSPRVSS